MALSKDGGALRGAVLGAGRTNETDIAVAERSSQTPPDPKTIAAMKKVYTIQFVGLAPNGKEPRSPASPEGNRCLFTIGDDDIPGGVGLSMMSCPHQGGKDAMGVPTGETKDPLPSQLFEFYPDGRIRNVLTGKCIRRVACQSNDVKIYDLGACDSESAATFEIHSARANRVDKTQHEGFPINGVRGGCEACGPFMLQQVCHGACGDDPAPTGWTRNPSSYIDNFDFTGKSGKLSYRNMSPNVHPLCNSFIRDGDAPLGSWWYFHKYDDPRAKA